MSLITLRLNNCDKAVREGPFSLQYVPDWFVKQQQVERWYDDDYYYDDNKHIEWYYKKRIKEKLWVDKTMFMRSSVGIFLTV